MSLIELFDMFPDENSAREWFEGVRWKQGDHCAGCREHFPKPQLHVDHITARSNGGTDHISNLQLLCPYCKSVKGNRGMEYLITQLQL